jgi:acyl-ACP thioesterase
MPISPNFTSILEQEYEINFLQCYPNGLLKYTELCNIFQITAGIHADLGGISFSDMQEHHQAWVMSKMRLEIINLPKWKEKVTVKTWIKSLENSRSTRCLELYRGDEKLAGCETYWAVLNTQIRKPENLALPHEHFIKYPEHSATEKSVQRINLDVSFEKVLDYKVQLSDLDIVNHANNVKYLEWCLNTMDKVIPEYGGADDDALTSIAAWMKGNMKEFLRAQNDKSGKQLAQERYDRFRKF